MPNYQYLINRRVLETFDAAEVDERSRLIAALNRLAAQSEQPCDFHERGDSEIEIRCKWFGNRLIRYRLDSPVRTVVVNDCQWI